MEFPHILAAMNGVNQQTLADRLGLSRATVSRCFTNHRAINPATRARVFELAAQLGYRYLDLRSPSTKGKEKVATLGVLIAYAGMFTERDRFENPGQKLLDGVSQLAQLRHAQLDVHYVDPSEVTLQGASYQRIKALQRGDWAGALLIYSFPGRIVDALLARFPCVSLVEQYGRVDMNCVDVDHYRGIAQIMDLLLESGHTRIGFFSPASGLETYWTMHRFSSYLEKLLALGLEFRPEDVINVLPASIVTEEGALEKMRAQTEDGVTAWVCAMDYGAYSVMTYLSDHGVRVPEDVSVTGFDGIRPPEGLPEVTTLEVPFREIGMTGSRRLLDLIQAPFDPPQHILLGCRLRRGETVGAIAPAPALQSESDGNFDAA